MIRQLFRPATILTGIAMLAACSFAQTYTVSAKPGAVNFIEGDVSLNGDPVWISNLKSTFLNGNDVLSVKTGKAEVLLTPGVFLRLGENSQVRMIKPSLIETQIEIVSGESMIEVDDIVPGSSVSVLDHGSSTTLIKPGLYRFTEHSIASLEGKAEVTLGGQTVPLKKNKEVELGDALLAKKVDLSQSDELYAWSNVRAQYNAAATYAGSRDAYNAGGYGYSSFSSPGWYWNSPYSTYMWLPGNGAFYSPFGWGFYGPGVVAYAPVIAVPYYGSGYYPGRGTVPPVRTSPPAMTTASILPTNISKPPIVVPINPKNVGVANFTGTSPAAFAAARMHMQQSANFFAMRTASGAPAASLRNGQTFSDMHAAARAAAASARSSAAATSQGGGWSGRSSNSNSGGGAWSGGHAAGSIGGSGGGSHASGGGHTSK